MKRSGVGGALAGVALVVVALAGCGTSAPSTQAAPSTTSAALPPRPATLVVDNVDPCTLLTPRQREQLGVTSIGGSSENFGGPIQGGPICAWIGIQRPPDNEYTGSVVLNHGAEYALGKEPLRTVGGYAATTTVSVGSDPNYYCGLLVDVAPGKALNAEYDNTNKDAPGMNRATACDNAQRLAEAMLVTLRAQQGR